MKLARLIQWAGPAVAFSYSAALLFVVDPNIPMRALLEDSPEAVVLVAIGLMIAAGFVTPWAASASYGAVFTPKIEEPLKSRLPQPIQDGILGEETISAKFHLSIESAHKELGEGSPEIAKELDLRWQWFMLSYNCLAALILAHVIGFAFQLTFGFSFPDIYGFEMTSGSAWWSRCIVGWWAPVLIMMGIAGSVAYGARRDYWNIVRKSFADEVS